MSRSQLMQIAQLKDRVNFFRAYLEPALAEGLIEMTQPESSKSPAQQNDFLRSRQDQSESVFKTERKADCGIMTFPTIFIRFFPFLCFSRSFRFLVMSPP